MSEVSQEEFQKLVDTCHQQLKEEKFAPIREYLYNRWITDELIDEYKIGYGKFYNLTWITIPILDANDEYLFIKLRKDPYNDGTKNKFMCYPRHSSAAIFGIKNFLTYSTIVVCEGEFDRIILESMGVPSISSTSGATGFKKEWTFAFKNCEKVYICLDKDDVGFKGADKIGKMILEDYPHIKVYNSILPDEVGEGGDITDLASLGGGEINLDKLFYENVLPVFPKQKEEKKFKRYNNEDLGNGEISETDVEKARKADCSKFVNIAKKGYDKSWAHCPLHEGDNTPSFCCYEGEYGWYCYGCGEGGDAIELIKKLYNLDFKEAVKFINS